jgi:hypothetical protein
VLFVGYRQSCLICVGLYDGNVALLQLKEDEENLAKSLVLRNSHTALKHRAPIWSVKFVPPTDPEDWPEFYSCAMDGQVIHWIVDPSTGGGLTGTPTATLHLPVPPVQGPDGTHYKLFGKTWKTVIEDHAKLFRFVVPDVKFS